MGARIILCDPHRAVVNGPTRLYGERMESPDIRAGMAMLIAGLCAEGRSTIGNIGQIDRGYERIDERLRALGASIERVDWMSDKRAVTDRERPGAVPGGALLAGDRRRRHGVRLGPAGHRPGAGPGRRGRHRRADRAGDEEPLGHPRGGRVQPRRRRHDVDLPHRPPGLPGDERGLRAPFLRAVSRPGPRCRSRRSRRERESRSRSSPAGRRKRQ